MAFVQGRVQDCDTGAGLGATLTDNVGNLGSTDTNGFWSTNVAYPGYHLTAGAYAHVPKTHVFTTADIQAGWVTICLTYDQSTPTSEGIEW
jgi:hypothetical protein